MLFRYKAKTSKHSKIALFQLFSDPVRHPKFVRGKWLPFFPDHKAARRNVAFLFEKKLVKKGRAEGPPYKTILKCRFFENLTQIRDKKLNTETPKKFGPSASLGGPSDRKAPGAASDLAPQDPIWLHKLVLAGDLYGVLGKDTS